MTNALQINKLHLESIDVFYDGRPSINYDQFHSRSAMKLPRKQYRHWLSLVIVIAVIGLGTNMSCGLTLALSGGGNIKNLVAGRPFQISVNLLDALPTQQFETLGVTVGFDASLLRPLAVVPGDIVPDPLDSPLDFYSNLGTRDAQVTFLTFGIGPADRIVGGGVFFSIPFMPLVPDSQGELTLSFGEVQQFNPLEPEEPLFPELTLSGPLTFAVTDSSPAIPGDFDFDRDVDGDDYLVWRQAFGSHTEFGPDGNGNGVVDAADYTIWRENFGAGKPGDYDRDSDVDGADYSVWRRDFGFSNSPADGNQNGVVDAADYVVWRQNLNVAQAGDYDRDNDVDGADYSVWRRDFGLSNSPADGNQNGVVDAADYVVWRRNVSVGTSTASLTVVPEPAASCYVMILAMAIFLSGHCRESG